MYHVGHLTDAHVGKLAQGAEGASVSV
jgi:hypothetical protein